MRDRASRVAPRLIYDLSPCCTSSGTPVEHRARTRQRPHAPAFLSQRKLAVARRCDGVAMFSIGWIAPGIAHDPGGLLALDVAIDAGHPGAHLVHELASADRENVIGPFADTGGSGLDPGEATLHRVLNDTGHPLDAVFRSARVVAEPGVRS